MRRFYSVPAPHLWIVATLVSLLPRTDNVWADSAVSPQGIQAEVLREFKLTHGMFDAAPDDRFGSAVAVYGDTAVIGAPNSDDEEGSAHVFVRRGETWSWQAKLTAAYGAVGDEFGASVAIWGETVVVGAPGRDDAGVNSGSVYVFVRDGSTWSLQRKLTAEDGATGDAFGFSVAISGETIVVGAERDDHTAEDAGSAYVFVRNEEIWSQQSKLTATNAANGDRFGSSVAIAGETVVVGAPLNDDDGNNSGSAYVFVPDGATWTEEAKLRAGDAEPQDRFGSSVAIAGETVVVGAPLNSDTGSYSGSAYVFVRSGADWGQQQKLTAEDAAAGDQFGAKVAISNGMVLVGAHRDGDAGDNSGSAHTFVLDGGSWIPNGKLTMQEERAGDNFDLVGVPFDDDADKNAGAACVFLSDEDGWRQQSKLTANEDVAGDRFGFSVSLSGDTVVVGAYGDDDAGENAGAAYVFVKQEQGWVQQQKLLAEDSAAGDEFGGSVAIDGDTIVLGADFNDEVGNDAGAAYVFVKQGTGWVQQAKLLAENGQADDNFGDRVAIDGDTIVVGAPWEDEVYRRSGAAYVFVRDGGIWNQEKKLKASDPAYEDAFGRNVAIDGDTVVVGAYESDTVTEDAGAAYVFVRTGDGWVQQKKLTVADAENGDRFGIVAIDDDTIVLGPEVFENAFADANAVHVFVRTGDDWVPQQKLEAEGAEAGDRFGKSVSIWGDTIVLGAKHDDDAGDDSGSAYIFVRDGDTWEPQGKLTAGDDAEAGDEFGYSVSVWGNMIVVGAPYDDVGGTDSGSVWVYELDLPTPPPTETPTPTATPTNTPTPTPTSTPTLVATGPDFEITTLELLRRTQGEEVTYTVMVEGVNGFEDQVHL